jgi:hypothetical protein
VGDDGKPDLVKRLLQGFHATVPRSYAIDDRGDSRRWLARRLYPAKLIDESDQGIDVDGRRQHRNDDDVGVAHQTGQIRMGEPRRRVDDDSLGVQRHAQLPASGHGHGALVGGHPVDRRTGLVAHLKPAGARALGIVIEERGGEATPGEVGGEIRGDGCLTGSPLGV